MKKDDDYEDFYYFEDAAEYDDEKPVSTKKYRRRAYETVELLSRNDRFNELVRIARRNLKIPLEGYTTDNEMWQWRHRLSDQDTAYLKKHDATYQQELEKYEGRKDVRSLAAKAELHLNFERKLPSEQFRAAIVQILRMAKLDGEWFHAVEKYVLRNLPSNKIRDLSGYVTGSDAIEVSSEVDAYTGTPKIVIKFGISTIKEEVGEMWHKVEALQKRIGKPRKDSREKENFERDLEIYDLIKTNLDLSSGEIAKKYNELHKDEEIKALTYSDVTRIYERISKTIDAII